MPRLALLLSVVAAGWFLLLSTKIPGLRRRAGLPQLSQSGHALREIADSLHIPTAWYASGLRSTVAPLTIAIAISGMVAGTAGALVHVQDRAVTVGPVTVQIQGQTPPEEAHLSVPPAVTASASTDVPDASRPTCAHYEVIAADLRQGGTPEAVTADLEAAWRRVNWPTLGCVAASPQRLGEGWYAQLHGAPSGSSLLVYIDGRAHVVQERFAALVLAIAPEVTSLSDRVDFGAGQYQPLQLPSGCQLLMTSPQRGALLLPPQVTEQAAAAGAELNAFPWVSDMEADAEYSVTMLVPITAYPGYMTAATIQISADASGAHQGAVVPPQARNRDCASIDRLLQRLAAPVSAAARTHRPADHPS